MKPKKRRSPTVATLTSLAIVLKKRGDVADFEARKWARKIRESEEEEEKSGRPTKDDRQFYRINLFEATGERRAYRSALRAVQTLREEIVKGREGDGDEGR